MRASLRISRRAVRCTGDSLPFRFPFNRDRGTHPRALSTRSIFPSPSVATGRGVRSRSIDVSSRIIVRLTISSSRSSFHQRALLHPHRRCNLRIYRFYPDVRRRVPSIDIVYLTSNISFTSRMDGRREILYTRYTFVPMDVK